MSSPASARPKPLWQPLCLVVGLFLLLISGSLLSQGMSEAGLKNSVIAQNVAEGYGAFWNPCPSEFDPAPEANNYLPLGYWLQSIVMRLWGKAPWLDKLYSMLIFLVEAFLMGALRHRAGNPRRTLWIPLLFWLAVPVVSWSATNNLLEGTQSVFVMLSVWCYLCGVHPAPSKVTAPQRYSLRRLLWVVGATACIGIAFLVKGFSALFPLAMPPLLWVVSYDKRRNRMPWIDWAVMAAVVAVSYLLFLLTGGETGRQVMYHYVHHQLIGGLLHVHTVASHFYILYALVLQLLPSLVLVGVVVLWLMRGGRARRRLLFWRPTSGASAADEPGMRYVYFFLLLGLTGVLPIMAGLKQQDYYLITTIPFFALALAGFVAPVVDEQQRRIGPAGRLVLSVCAVLAVVSGLLLNLNSVHRYSQDAVLVSDMNRILPHLQQDEIVSVSREMKDDPLAQYYFYRYKNIRFDTSLTHPHLLTLYAGGVAKWSGYRLLQTNTSKYNLYERIPYEPVYDKDTVDL